MQQRIEAQFERMGARARVTVAPEPRAEREARRWRMVGAGARPIRVNILRDGKGEYFEIVGRSDVDVSVIDVQPADRHLVLMSRQRDWLRDESKSKFLCGHDERAWFVAAIPESAAVSSVQDAKDALKPQEVWDSILAHGVPMHRRDDRWTAGFVRQGEWFFIPRPEAPIDSKLILQNEPIRRGAGKPHICQFMFRTGGEQVHVNSRYPNGLSTEEFRNLQPFERTRGPWRVMTRNARVYVKGTVRHPDHKTICLPGWYEVVMNTETQARAMRDVAFLD